MKIILNTNKQTAHILGLLDIRTFTISTGDLRHSVQGAKQVNRQPGSSERDTTGA